MISMHRHRKPTVGFTLVELLVVVAIIAIIMVFGFPSYQSALTQNRMGTEISDLNTDIELARSAAVKQGLPVTICAASVQENFDPTAKTACATDGSWASGWIVFIDTASSQTFDTTIGDTMLRAHPAFQGTDTLTGYTGTDGNNATSAFSGSLSYLTFNRMGGTAIGANYAAITLHNSANNSFYNRCVIVSNVGLSVKYSQVINGGYCP